MDVDPIAVAVGAALVSAMATDTWQQARTSVVTLCRRLRPPRQTEAVEAELEALHRQILAVREQGRPDLEQDLAEAWQDRLQELLSEDPAVAGELRKILQQTLTPMLDPADQARIGRIILGDGSRHTGTVNLVGGDQHNQTVQILAPAAAPVRAVNSLRADIATFTGRSEQIQEIAQAISTVDGTASGVAVIYAINGMPGVGKTALAVHLSHLVADRFPDGQLFVDLHAYSIDHAPADPAAVLASLLAVTGMAPEQIPDGEADRAAAWRDRMAGKCLLLVLDNAASDEQVKPLLPGSCDCLVLVTSRRRLAGLCRDSGATILPLGVLPEPDALALFTRVFAHPLAAADQQTTLDLVRLCGCLPLAITIVAAGIDPGEATTVADLLTDLESARDRLAVIDAHLDDEERGVAAAFDLSYQRLTPQEQRVLRLLSLTPGTDIDPYAAAALTDLPLEVVRGHLHALRTHRLIEKPAHDRYRLHDLTALYARTLTCVEERDPALERVLDYYQHAAAIAAAGLSRYSARLPRTREGSGPTVPDLSSQARAITWLRAERANLLACLQHTRRYRQHTRLVDLTASLGVFLDQDGPPAERIELRTHALGVCREIGDRTGEAWNLRELGAARNITGNITGNYAQSICMEEQALAIFRELGDRGGEAYALIDLGDLHLDAGDYSQTQSLQEQALTIFREVGDRRGEVRALDQLGDTCRITGDYPQATELQEQALTISREIGSRGGEAWALSGLGVLQQIAGHYPPATDLQEQALTISREVGDRHAEAIALVELGALRRITGDYPQASGLLEQALTITQERDDRRCEAWVLGELGALRRITGDYPQASGLLEQALTITRENSRHDGEAEILNHQGALSYASGDLVGARERHLRALDLARELGTPLEEARALAGAGRCAIALRITAGPAELSNALEIFQRIGAAEMVDLTAEIDDLPPPDC